jgi:hypothetical protein
MQKKSQKSRLPLIAPTSTSRTEPAPETKSTLDETPKKQAKPATSKRVRDSPKIEEPPKKGVVRKKSKVTTSNEEVESSTPTPAASDDRTIPRKRRTASKKQKESTRSTMNPNVSSATSQHPSPTSTPGQLKFLPPMTPGGFKHPSKNAGDTARQDNQEIEAMTLDGGSYLPQTQHSKPIPSHHTMPATSTGIYPPFSHLI